MWFRRFGPWNPPDDATPLAGVLARMGAPLYYCPDPGGYPGSGYAPTARDMAARASFAAGLAGRLGAVVEAPPGLSPQALRETLGGAQEPASGASSRQAPGREKSRGRGSPSPRPIYPPIRPSFWPAGVHALLTGTTRT